MKPLRLRLQEARAQSGLQWETLERDYLLSWILAGIGGVDILRDTLAFKGGTALKKCYFGDYRFSEDLDFSALEGAPSGGKMERSIKDACRVAAELLDEFAPAEIVCRRYTEKMPHPEGQEAFEVRARLPWHRRLHTRILVEISMEEQMLWPIEERNVLHEYGEPLETRIKVYSLEEIVAEKLRAILQHVEKLKERGWSRSRARDYYDLWRMFGSLRDRMDLSGFSDLLRKKCALKAVAFEGPSDFFQEPMLSQIEKTWEQWLGPLVPDLPNCEAVMHDLHPLIASLLTANPT